MRYLLPSEFGFIFNHYLCIESYRHTHSPTLIYLLFINAILSGRRRYLISKKSMLMTQF